MKLPRWLVWTLLAASIAGGVVFPAWWWKVWPGRTASAFIAAVREADFERANQFLEKSVRWEVGPYPGCMMLNHVNPEYGYGASVEEWQELAGSEAVRIEPRTLEDILRGRQRFSLWGAPVYFSAKRDTIELAFDGFPR